MHCPVCHTEFSSLALKLADVPTIANQLHTNQQNATQCKKNNISLKECTNCKHIYNIDFNHEEINYDFAYHNSLFTSAVFTEEAKIIANDIDSGFNLTDKAILEIACGDGKFTHLLNKFNVKKIIATDKNLAIENSYNNNIEFIASDFTAFSTKETIDIIIARHFLEHIDLFDEFFSFLAKMQSEDLYIYIEVPNADYMLNENSMCDIIYEHAHYFNSQSLSLLFEKNDFQVMQVKEYFNQQFLGLYAKKKFTHAYEGYYSSRTAFKLFKEQCETKITEWNKALEGIKDKNVFVWGAGSKGISFLNLIDEPTIIKGIIDINPAKQGHFISGTGHKIFSVNDLKDIRPDYIFIANINYTQEIQSILSQHDLSCEIKHI